jgi:hypothetical protein
VIHVLRVPTRVVSERDLGARWCFHCRKRLKFILRVHVPTDEMSYYGAHSSVSCERGHLNGDCFPGRIREGGDEL